MMQHATAEGEAASSMKPYVQECSVGRVLGLAGMALQGCAAGDGFDGSHLGSY